MKQKSYFDCKFHKVESCTWMRTRHLIQQLLLARVARSSEFFTFSLSADDFHVLQDFIEDMDIAYLHPRRDSFFLRYLASTYANFVPTAKFAADSHQIHKGKISCHPRHEKNLSERRVAA